jgi:apolipoprotein N-acyltransferase
MRVADPRMYYTWWALAVYCSLYLPVAILLIRRLDRLTGLPLVLTVPVVWTALEFFRVHFGTGFGWYLLGHAQHSYLVVIQVADLAGVYAVSFMAAAVNALVFELLCANRHFRTFFSLEAERLPPPRRTVVVSGVSVLALLLAAVSYGYWRLGQEVMVAGPRVALIQGNLEQRVRNLRSSGDKEAGQKATETMLEHYSKLSARAADQRPRPDLIVWPETSFPDEWLELSPDFHPERNLRVDAEAWRINQQWRVNRDVLAGAGWWQIPMLIGLNSQVLLSEKEKRRFNSALLVVPGDKALVDGYAVWSVERVQATAMTSAVGSLAPPLPAGPLFTISTLLPDCLREWHGGQGYLSLAEPGRGPTRLGPWDAVPIRKGMVLPPGADAVLWEHNVRREGSWILVNNSAPLRLGQNVTRWADRYDKIHRVLFGEYVPLVDWLPFMNTFAPYDYEYSISPGEHLTRFAVTAAHSGLTYHFGTIICFEDSDTVLARSYACADRDGPPVDFLVNISNDGWFSGTSEHEEHLAVCRFRAVESRRSIARAVNMGISAVIDGNGRVLTPETISGDEDGEEWVIADDRAADLPLSRWGQFKKVRGLLTATIPIDRRLSLYAMWGDWLAWMCWGVLAGGLIWSSIRGGQRVLPR